MASRAATFIDERHALEWQLQSIRPTQNLRLVERELARVALANANVLRLMAIPGIYMVVTVG